MIKKLKIWFQNYTRGFYTSDPYDNRSLLLKAEHCIRTAGISREIALREHFEQLECDLAHAAGLLHDIGRFEQYRRFRTFADHNSIDHGKLGEDITRAHPCLEDLPAEHQDLIHKSIRYHNQLSLPEDETPRVLRFTRLVRDADKIDIFRIASEYFAGRTEKNKNAALELNAEDRPEISDTIFDRIMSGQNARMRDIRTLDDFKAIQINWVFDINYPRSFELIAENRALEKIYLTVSPGNTRAEKIYSRARSFLEQQLKAKTHP